MRIESIHIEEGLFERKIDFDTKVNLIYSTKNSCGKTTLLRFILYGLGYHIPNTRKIKFEKCRVKTNIWCENLGNIVVERNNSEVLRITKNNSQQLVFVLPNQEDDVHSFIFSTEEKNILHNLLGAFYIDQEKGWTLLNRGVVIGSNRFSIEELVRGLSGIDCNELIAEKKELKDQISKYSEISSVFDYRDKLLQNTGSIITSTYEEETEAEIDLLVIQQNQLKKELRRIDTTLSDNKRFRKYISDFKLLIRCPNDEIIEVTEDNIVGLNDIIDLLISKKKIIVSKLNDIDGRIKQITTLHTKENMELGIFKSLTPIEVFDKAILSIPLSSRTIENQIKDLNKKLSSIRDEISRTTNMNNEISKEISADITGYVAELGIENSIPADYLYTSNLKELSGAVLHKTVFAFRMAYIRAIEKKLKIKLPIILDSPSGKEIDRDNIALMMKIIQRDFFDHQIIIASIFDNYFDDENIIEIRDRLIDETKTFR